MLEIENEKVESSSIKLKMDNAVTNWVLCEFHLSLVGQESFKY